MPEVFLANSLVILHLCFILFVVTGGLLTLRWRWIPYLHIPAVLWGAYIEFFNIICPLTPLEQELRQRAGQAGYSGGFIEHYLIPIIYPPGLETWHQLVLGLMAVIINLTVYGYVILYGYQKSVRSH